MGVTGTDKVCFEVDDHLATVTINRPEKLNAMDTDTYAGLSRAAVEIRDNPEIWGALITGEGDDSFSTGADLHDYVSPGDEDWDAFWRTQEDMLLNRGLEVWKPIVSAVNGYCLGGGLTLLLATDVRVASSDATFGLTEVQRGLLPANGGTQRIARQLPYTAAMEILLTGDMFDAEQAEKWDLVNRVVPPGEVQETAEEIARNILSNGPLALQAVKELAIRGPNMSLDDAIRLESSFRRHLYETDDLAEGVKAFREDREPDFRGK